MAVIPPMVEEEASKTTAKAVAVDLRNVGIRTMETIIAQTETKITSVITITTIIIIVIVITIKQVELVVEAIISQQPLNISRITTSAKPMPKTSGITPASTRFKMNRCRNRIVVHRGNSSMARKVAVPKVVSMEKEEMQGHQAIQMVVLLETLLEVKKVAMEAASSNTITKARPHRTIPLVFPIS